MSKVFITALGVGTYAECAYQLGDLTEKDRFEEKALLRLLKSKGISYDRVVVFMSKESCNDNWDAYVRGGKTSSEIEGLRPFLEAQFPDAQLVPVIIPTARSESEVKEIFRLMYQSIEEDDAITFDVTHGFRTMPLLFSPLLDFARETKHITVDAMYYGAYESRNEEGVAPIFDVTNYFNIPELVTATHCFNSFGNGKQLQRITRDLNRKAQKENVLDDTYQLAYNTADSMENFASTIRTNRGSNHKDFKKSIMVAQERVKLNRERLKRKTTEDFSPMNMLLLNALDATKAFDEKTMFHTGLESVKWCIDKGLVQQGYTDLMESIITYTCKNFGYGERIDDYIREKVVAVALNSFKGVPLDSEKAARSAAIEESKKYAKKLSNVDRENFNDIVSGVSLELVGLVQKVEEYRSDINEFGMRSKPIDSDEFERALVDLYEEACQIMGYSAS